MSASGVDHPNVIDLVTRNGDEFILCVAEARHLDNVDAIVLQAKLNSYLAFACDGELRKHYPESRGCPITIRVELHGGASPFISEFLRRYATHLVEHGVQFIAEVRGEPVA